MLASICLGSQSRFTQKCWRFSHLSHKMIQWLGLSWLGLISVCKPCLWMLWVSRRPDNGGGIDTWNITSPRRGNSQVKVKSRWTNWNTLHNLMDTSWRVYKYIGRWYGWRHIYLKYMHLRGENTQLHNAFLVKCAICYCILDAAKFQSGCKQSVRNRLSELVRPWRRQHAKKKYMMMNETWSHIFLRNADSSSAPYFFQFVE